jgi:hypothetical protein
MKIEINLKINLETHNKTHKLRGLSGCPTSSCSSHIHPSPEHEFRISSLNGK